MIGAISSKLSHLRARDKEVREHEQAHFQAAGELARSGPVITDYVTGADGQQYADGGHVMIDTSETGNPREDLHRGEIIVRAAEAPEEVHSELSDADRKVAAQGRAMIAKNTPLLEKIDKLKGQLGDRISDIPQGQLARMATGLGLELPPGQILNLVA